MKPNLHSSRFGRAAWAVVWLLLFPAAIIAVESAQGAAFQVNTTSDEDDVAPGDEACATASGQCTLRAAIQQANHASDDIISFAIPATDPGFDPGSGRHTINLTKALPTITATMKISGPAANKLTVRRNTGEPYPVFVVVKPDEGAVSISGMTISRGYHPSGGGIYSLGSRGGTLNVTDCMISGNAAAGAGGRGGGIWNFGTLNVINSTLSGNSAAQGGGIVNTIGTVNIINSTISGNWASDEGGGIFNPASSSANSALLNISHSTITGNSARSHGGVFNGQGSPATVKSSIIALNIADLSPDLGGAFTSNGYNLIGDADGVTSPRFDGAGDQKGTSAKPLDAKLDPNGLQDNGGPTQTIALLFGSPAIDKGTSNFGPINNLATDQRGPAFARTFDNPAIANASGGDGTDIGAFEVQSASTTPGLSTLANISTRSLVQTGDNVLIGGFIVVGSNPKKVIVRAIGPSLPFAGVLADPTLELRDANGGLLRSNDNWRTGGQEGEIIATGIPPTNELESALVETLAGSGASYTAVVRGVNNTTGIAVVEIYALN